MNRSGWCSIHASVCSTAPVRDTAATFTPVRKPGSSPITMRSPAGAASRSCSRLRPKMAIASSSARVLSSSRSSTSIDIASSRLYASWATSRELLRGAASRRSTRAARPATISSAGAATVHASTPSSSPRRIASTRCDGMVPSGSEKS